MLSKILEVYSFSFSRTEIFYKIVNNIGREKTKNCTISKIRLRSVLFT